MIIVIMGVAGSGKTTVGRMLAERLGWQYFDADDFHSAANVEKMRSGVPLDDADRQPWLACLHSTIRKQLSNEQSAIVACSALRKSYRERLRIDDRVRFVYLNGNYELVHERLRERRNHYMNPELLDTQFEILEEPEDALKIDIQSSPEAIVEIIRGAFQV